MISLNKIFEDYFNEWIHLFPLDATLMGFDILNEIDEIPISISEEFKEREINFYKKYKNLAKSVDQNLLNEKNKFYLKAFKFTCDLSLKELSFPDNLLPINHFFSFHLLFPSISSGLNQNFEKKKDILNFYKKINFFKNWIEEVIKNLKKGIELDITLPFAVVKKIMEQIDFILKLEKKNNPCFKAVYLTEKSYKGKNKEKEIINLEKEISEKIIFSYNNLYSFLKDEYIKKSKKEIGYFSLPEGDEWYKTKILKYTTLNLNPSEIYDFANEELKKLRNEYLSLKEGKKIEKDFIEFLKKLKKDLKEKLKDYFYKFPERDFIILPMGKLKEKTSSIGEYFLGGIDEKSKPIFYINSNLAKEKTSAEVLSMFFHEAIPGHHLQISLQRENKNLPSFLRYHLFEAFVEGWALYSENLPYDLGILKEEAYKKSVLKNQIWRTLRLILDTGIHTGKMEKENAINYLINKGDFKRKEAEIEILRYAVLPGQALTYKIGEKMFIDLKKEAEKKLKEKFKLKDFHKILLEDGSLPLELLKYKVKSWIKNKK